MVAPRILLVDDDPEDREVLIDAFQHLQGCNDVLCADNGEAALTLLSQNNLPLPHLIVLDLNMPKMNGTQTLKALKADNRYREIVAVILSTSINPVEKEACISLGAHAYIAKPTSYQESLAIAQMFLDWCHFKSQ